MCVVLITCWVASRGGKVGFYGFVYLTKKTKKPGKVDFFVFYGFWNFYFSSKFCAQTIIFYYNFIFNLHEFTLPLASTA